MWWLEFSKNLPTPVLGHLRVYGRVFEKQVKCTKDVPSWAIHLYKLKNSHQYFTVVSWALLLVAAVVDGAAAFHIVSVMNSPSVLHTQTPPRGQKDRRTDNVGQT